MARMTAAHRTQITIALITVAGGILVAVLTSWDKLFPPAPAVQRNEASAGKAAGPVGDQSTQGLERLKQAQEDLVNRSAGTLDDITRQIDAQSANLQGR